jgi:hypothetical protein
MSSPDPNAPPPDPNAAPPRLPHHTDAYLAETKGPTILATCITLCVVSTMFVAARLFTRQKLMGKLLSDDYIVGASMVSLFFFLSSFPPNLAFGAVDKETSFLEADT